MKNDKLIKVYVLPDIDNEIVRNVRVALEETLGGLGISIKQVSPDDIVNIAEEMIMLNEQYVIVILASGEHFKKLFSSYANYPQIVVLHPRRWDEVVAKVQEALSYIGITVSDTLNDTYELIADLDEEDLITEVLKEKEIQADQPQPTEKEKQKQKRNLLSLLKALQQREKKKQKKHKKKKKKKKEASKITIPTDKVTTIQKQEHKPITLLPVSKKAKGTWIFSGLHIGTTFYYHIASDNMTSIVQEPLTGKYYEDVKKHLDKEGVDVAWLTPLRGYTDWFVIYPPNDAHRNVIRFLQDEKVYPIHAYYLLMWSPPTPQTVIIADLSYFVAITKWENTLIDVKFSPYSNEPATIRYNLLALLSSIDSIGIPRVYIPTTNSNDYTSSHMQSVYNLVSNALNDRKDVEVQLLDTHTLPSPEGLPRFKKVSKFSLWDMVYDPAYLKHMSKAVALLSIAFLLTGTSVGVVNAFNEKRVELYRIRQYLNQQADMLNKTEQKVTDLQKYNAISKEQIDYPSYLAKLVGLFGNRLKSFSYSPYTKKATATFITDEYFTLKKIQELLFTNNLVSEIFISNIRNDTREVTLTFIPIIRGEK